MDVLSHGDQVSAEELRLLEKHLPDVLKAVVAIMNVDEE
jgi:hypothetical protein